MAEKEWGYTIILFPLENESAYEATYGTRYVDYAAEIMGISPYGMVAGFNGHMKSEDFEKVKNAQQLGDFVRWIGDKNTLSIKKQHDEKFYEFLDVRQSKIRYEFVGLAVSPIGSMPERVADRTAWLTEHKTEGVLLKRVSVSAASTDGTYDWVTFVADKVDFYFY